MEKSKTNKELTPNDYLAMLTRNIILMEGHLNSIRGMLTFFTVILILDILFQLVVAFFR